MKLSDITDEDMAEAMMLAEAIQDKAYNDHVPSGGEKRPSPELVAQCLAMKVLGDRLTAIGLWVGRAPSRTD